LLFDGKSIKQEYKTKERQDQEERGDANGKGERRRLLKETGQLKVGPIILIPPPAAAKTQSAKNLSITYKNVRLKLPEFKDRFLAAGRHKVYGVSTSKCLSNRLDDQLL
jgi:hypothetical protein